MRILLIALPLALTATPAVAQPPAPELPRVLTDPAMADRLGHTVGALTRSLMDLPVGEVEAAIEGRPATPADRAKRVRDSVGDPDLDQRVAAEAAQSGRKMQAATRALAASLPSIMAALERAEVELERAVANLPDPTYPRQ
jgi:hypothetical protein